MSVSKIWLPCLLSTTLFTLAADSQQLVVMAKSFISGIDFCSLALDTEGNGSEVTFQGIQGWMTSPWFVVVEFIVTL